jgi:hypothetical protein
MRLRTAIIGAAVLVAGFGLMAAGPKPAASFTADGKLEFPTGYREWVYLSSGFDMSYQPGAQAAGRHVFDNVFVDRAAYAAFQKTGRWPEGTVFALEVRTGSAKGSINQAGQFQTERIGLEVHVKDRRFASGWGFVGFRGEAPAQPLPQSSACNSCHEAHGAVETTFVQFYPTLLPVAREKNTLSDVYLAEGNPR